jgi:tRNA threonylcarbamoyladenosine biosynthesis protein TsaE
MKFIAESETQLVDKTYELLKNHLKAGFGVGLRGDLGAGKTSLVKGLLNRLNISEPVTSPTFTLRKIYTLPDNLKVQHIDLYRLADQSAVNEEIEWLEDKSFLTFVEWPEKIVQSDKYFDLIIEITPRGQSSREVSFKWN